MGKIAPKLRELELEVPLKASREGDDTEYTKIMMRRMKAKDFKLLPDSWFIEDAAKNPSGLIPIIAKLSGHTEEVIQEMDAVDVVRAAEIVADFLILSPRTGKKLFGE